MGFFTQAISAIFKAAKPPENRYISNNTLSYEESHRAIKGEDHRKLVDSYRNDVFSVIRLISKHVATAQLNLYVAKKSSSKLLNQSRTISKNQSAQIAKSSTYAASRIKAAMEVEEVTQHPFLELLQNVNQHYNYWDFMFLTNVYLELTGNAYWYLVRDSLGRIVELWPMPSQNMWAVPDKTSFVKGYIMRGAQGAEIPFDTDEIIHFREPSPISLYYGASWVQAISDAYNLQVNIDRHDVAFFSNMARPDGILEIPENSPMHPDAFERLKKAFRQKYTSVRNMAIPLILEGGIKYQAIGHAPSNLGLNDSRRDVLERICRASGVSVDMLAPTSANRATVEAAQVNFQRDTIKPRLTLIQEKINEKIMPLYGSELFVAYENTIPEDKEFLRLQEDMDINRGIRTRNEVRNARGLEPLPPEYGDVVPPLPGENPLMGIVQQPIKQVKKKSIERAAKWKAFADRVAPLEKAFADDLKPLFEAQRDRVLANLRRKKSKAESGIPPLDEITFNMNEEVDEFNAALKPSYKKVIMAAGKYAEEIVIGLRFDVKNPRVDEFIGGKLAFMSDAVNDTTLNAIKEQIRLGVDNGESIDDIAQRIELVYEDAIGYRATMIARTEVIGAYAEGSKEAYRQGGITKMEWLATYDNRTRDDHMALDGKVTGIDEGWDFPDGVHTSGPGLSGVAAHDINCRCAVAPVVEEF